MVSSVAAMACPNLNGQYNKCTTGNLALDLISGINKTELTLNQTGKNIEAEFMDIKTQVEVDQTTRTTTRVEDKKLTIHSEIFASCQKDSLFLDEDSELVYDNGKTSQSSTDTEIYLENSNQHIVMDITESENGQRKNLKVTCTRK
ncbi:MAG: hypothetical protein CME62_15965 [Halobacteriovoraceae bacterium]|nr:hypothetical protein [Halobacteriovoraceae bacterium]|tara:strand:- start:13023 stop:13460 length:438 start_codon:yes stop_codon:yes gene_type:complete